MPIFFFVKAKMNAYVSSHVTWNTLLTGRIDSCMSWLLVSCCNHFHGTECIFLFSLLIDGSLGF